MRLALIQEVNTVFMKEERGRRLLHVGRALLAQACQTNWCAPLILRRASTTL